MVERMDEYQPMQASEVTGGFSITTSIIRYRMILGTE